MLKKLGYISYLLGLAGLIFVTYILVTESNLSRIEPFLILVGIITISICQWLFITYTLKTLNNRSYNKINTIDEYLTMGMENNQTLKQLPLIWKIIGWIILISSVLAAITSMGIFSEYAFSTWKKFDIYAIFAFFTFAIAIVSVLYTLQVINRKWVGEETDSDEL